MAKRGERTLGQNLPLGGLASWRIGQDVVQFIEKALHLTPPLPLSHFVAHTKLWSPTVVSTSGGESCCVVCCALQTGDTAVLHGVMVGGRHVCDLLACDHDMIKIGLRAIIQTLLAVRHLGVYSINAAID